jgi:hypothetical protein
LDYGAVQDSKKGEFLAELLLICDDDSLPMLAGGDFNIKNNKMPILMLDGFLL